RSTLRDGGTVSQEPSGPWHGQVSGQARLTGAGQLVGPELRPLISLWLDSIINLHSEFIFCSL
ncbi:hypothetical protein RRG08_048475, partial [Elysia crispata]